VYDYITKGQSASNVRLQDNDMVIVEPYKNLIATKGSLKRERIYELKDGETLSDLLQYAGGFSGNAFTEKVTVSRRNGDRYQISTVLSDNFPIFKMKDGDMLEVDKTIPIFNNRVSVSGAVWREGNYELTPKTQTLSALIESAGGLKGDAFTNRGQITRQLPDYSFEIISVDIKKILSGESQDVALQSNDKLYIPSIYDLSEKQYIKIFGEVNLPKLTEIERKRLVEKKKLERDIKEQRYLASISSAQVKNDSIASIKGYPVSEDLLVTEPPIKDAYAERYDYDVRDSLYVNRSDKNVIPFSKGMTIQDAILLAGGMKESASEAKVLVARRMKNNTSTSAPSIIAEEFSFAISKDLKILDGGESFVLEPFDEIYVRKSPGYVMQRRVKVMGEIAFPGDYVLTKTGERISSVLNKAGEFTQDAYISGIKLIRKKTESEIERERVKIMMSQRDEDVKMAEMDLKIDSVYTVGIDVFAALADPGSYSDPVLREGDVILIPVVTNTIRISGAVLYPNTVSYVADKKYKYYIESAGGYVQRARKKPYIIYMNGTVALARKGAKIEPGCEIIVPARVEKTNPLGVQGWLGLATSLTSVAAMSTSIISSLNK
ncbi:MAG: SLBB domain-containing protein, partial [Rikenellaceae bacterium]